MVAERRKTINDQSDIYSLKITEMTRTVGYGLAGLFLVFSLSNSEFAIGVMHRFKFGVAALSVIGCMVILLEYLQYKTAIRALDEAESFADDPSAGELFATKIAARITMYFKYKQYLALVGGSGFILLMALAVFM
jgi:hypothetical protein